MADTIDIILNWIAIGGGAFVAILSFINLFTKSLSDVSHPEYYTRSSIRKLNKFDNIMYTIIGIVLVLAGIAGLLAWPEWLRYICYGVMFILILVVCFMKKKILVERSHLRNEKKAE